MTAGCRVGAALALAVAAVVAASGQARFRSTTVGVRVDVLVTDGKLPIVGLTAADFELRDEGVVQTVSEVDLEQLPLNLILVFDTSGSVAGRRMRALLDASTALLDELRDADRVALMTFSSRVRLLAPLTPSRTQIRAALGTLKAFGSTSLRDATFAGLALREGDAGRTLVLIFSDGADTSSWLPRPKVIDAAKRTDAVVYAVAAAGEREIAVRVPPRIGGAPITNGLSTRVEYIKEAGKFLEGVTKETGGRVVFATSDQDLRTVFTRTLAEFRNRYVLSYVPTGVSPKGWHRLDVRLKARKGHVTARRGYFAE